MNYTPLRAAAATLAAALLPSLLLAQDTLVVDSLVDTVTAAVDTVAAVVPTAPSVPSGPGLFGSLASLAALVVPATGFVKKYLVTKAPSQVLSWSLSVALAYGASALGLGLFAATGPVGTLVYGLAGGLIANGLFDVSLTQSLLAKLNLAKVPGGLKTDKKDGKK